MGISLTDDCWGLWPERGFLPSSDPMSHLSQYPDVRNYLETNTIDHLEKLSQELEGALANKTFSGSIDALPMLDTSSMVRLSANNHLIERTLLLYSNFANAYVFEDPDKPKKFYPLSSRFHYLSSVKRWAVARFYHTPPIFTTTGSERTQTRE